MYGDLSEILPRIGQDVYYPVAEEITHAGKDRTKVILQQLYEEGYLERQFQGRIYRCPHDNTPLIRPRVACPKCNSDNLEKHLLIEHIICGHVDLEKSFMKEGTFVCPKDHKSLFQIGVDYRKAGIAYKCSSCGNLCPLPVERWVCNVSNHVFSLDEAISEDFYSYGLREDKREEISRILEYISPIAEAFRKNEFSVETFVDVIGISGISHPVDIYAKKGSSGRTETVIADILVEDAIRPEAVLALYGVVLDTNPTRAMLIAIPKLCEESRFYAAKLSITAVEGKDLETVNRQLENLLNKDRLETYEPEQMVVTGLEQK